jgi:hypothetical protein
MAYDRGLETATLSEVCYRIIARKIARIDFIPNYEHRHRAVADVAKCHLNREAGAFPV